MFAATVTVNEISQQILKQGVTNTHGAECLMLYTSPKTLNIRGREGSTSGIYVKVKNPICAEGHSDLKCCAVMAVK